MSQALDSVVNKGLQLLAGQQNYETDDINDDKDVAAILEVLNQLQASIVSVFCSLNDTRQQQPALTKAVITCCRLAGKLRDYERVINVADCYLEHCNSAHAVLVGYKGYAYYKLQKYEQAVIYLESSHLLFQNWDDQNSKRSRLAKSVEQTVRMALFDTCRILGRDPPLPQLLKFPRTSHLFDIKESRAISSDDKILPNDHALVKQLCDGTSEVILEEKLDGANLGISYWYGKFLVQNRSHYISSGEHAQFDPLHGWVQEHREALYELLHSQRYILYGEWLVARHSTPYLRLPGYFMAFDLFDKESCRFVSRKKFHTLLYGSGIPVVPVLSIQRFGPHRSIERLQAELLQFVNTTKSQFRIDNGPIEGVVLRWDEGDWNVDRSKVVRPDFIGGCQDGHWTRRQFEKQRIDVDFYNDYLERCYHLADVPTTISCQVDRRVQAVFTRGRLDDNENYRGTTIRMVPAPKPSLNGKYAATEVGDNDILLPSSLCWLWQGEVVLSNTPSSPQQMEAFRLALNVGMVLSLSTELPREWFGSVKTGIQQSFYAIHPSAPPTLSQMDSIGDDVVRTVAAGNVLLICGDDIMSVVAALLLRFGKEGVHFRLTSENESHDESPSLFPRSPRMTIEQVLEDVRSRFFTWVTDTDAQIAFVGVYADHLNRVADSFHVASRRTMSVIDGESHRSRGGAKGRGGRPKLIVLSGIPCSGKTTFAKRLAGSPLNKKHWIHASTDELGREGCEALVGLESARVAQGVSGGVIIDCCNVQVRERLHWIQIMHQPDPKHTALVFFDTPLDVAISRVQYRVGHPTIPFGRGERIVRGFASRLEAPASPQEQSAFGHVEVVRTESDVARLLAKWKCAVV